MDEAESLCNILGGAEGIRCGIIAKLQVFQVVKKYFDRRMEDLGVRGYKRV